MLVRNCCHKLALIIAFGSGLLSAIALAQTVQPQRQMLNLQLPKLHFPDGKRVVELPFEVEGNWMVIPVSINGSRPLGFVLDTGAQGTVLQNPEIADSLNFKITGKMAVRGAGGAGAGREASIAENVTFNIGGMKLSNGRLIVSPPSSDSGSMTTHEGIIGRIVFATLVVEVDWEKQVIRCYEPSKYKYLGPGTVLPLTLDEGGRPYTAASVAVADEKLIPVKLVVDTGGSHVLSLDAGSKPEIKLPEGAAKVVLGRGASGEITGMVIAFRDIAPRAPTHILIISRDHIASAADLTEDHAAMLGRLFAVAAKIARDEGIADGGYRLVSNVGRWGGQTVDHLHVHLLGGRPFSWPPG